VSSEQEDELDEEKDNGHQSKMNKKVAFKAQAPRSSKTEESSHQILKTRQLM